MFSGMLIGMFHAFHYSSQSSTSNESLPVPHENPSLQSSRKRIPVPPKSPEKIHEVCGVDAFITEEIHQIGWFNIHIYWDHTFRDFCGSIWLKCKIFL